METRSQREMQYKNLEKSLKELGLYEDGMQLEEMRDIFLALENSIGKQQERMNQSPQDLNKILDGDMDLVSIPQVGFLNSTMIANAQQPTFNASADDPLPLTNEFHAEELESCSRVTTPLVADRDTCKDNGKCGDDDEAGENRIRTAGPIRITVQAEVHHELNWSPPQRTQNQCVVDLKHSICNSSLDSAEPNSKRSRMSDDQTPASIVGSSSRSNDSGVNWDERGSSLFDESLPISTTNDANPGNRLLVSTSSAAISDDSRISQGRSLDVFKSNSPIVSADGGGGGGGGGDGDGEDEFQTFL